MKVLVVAPHLQTFIRDQLAAVLPQLDGAEALVLRSRWSPFDPLSTSVAGSGRDLRIPVRVHRSVFLAARWPAPLFPWSRAVGTVRKALRRVRFDLVHAHFLYAAGAVAVRAAQAEGVPCVVTAHGFDVYDLPFRNTAWRRAVTDVLRECAAVITVSERNAEVLRKLGVERPVRVIPNGFDPDLFHPGDATEARKGLGLPEGVPLLVSVGHLTSVKGPDITLKAVARMRSPVHLAFVGRGPLLPELRALTARLGLRDRVRFVGEVPHPRVAEYLRAADLLVIGSRDEGNPAALVEALACGTPAVATRVGGIPEVLDAASGVLVEPGDDVALAEGVGGALETRWDRAAIAASTARWAWPVLAREIAAVYADAARGAS
ncbi:MAG TPA: glycosyltransferase [Thermoplasmata archaeon]|nr:glycosyltransferase [Thermoplasmata archaeon]